VELVIPSAQPASPQCYLYTCATGFLDFARDDVVYRIQDLRNWPEATGKIDPPIRLGVFGDPVEHSLSPQIQNAALRHSGIGIEYGRFQIAARELVEAFELAQDNQFVGFNLTLPHKITALGLVDACDPLARQISAVNTIKIDKSGTIGYNTDASGFARAVRESFSVDLRDLRVLLLGAGGAARAIAFQCALENCERLVIANRSLEKARGLAEELRPRFTGPRLLGPVARLDAIPLRDESLRVQIANTDLIVNATSLGLDPADVSPISAPLLAPHLIVLDCVYRGGKTPFLRAAEQAGARACDGRAMLLQQGAAAFEIWFDREAPLDVMRAAL
jgi:shikimate dehydrogenase